MAHSARDQHSPATYLDGISVKISERYKPPKRITLALSYSQMLALNKLVQEPTPGYDFSLEASVKNRVHEWREARTTLSDERKHRLHSVYQERPRMVWSSVEASEPAEALGTRGNVEEPGPAAPSNNNNHKDSAVSESSAGPYYSSESGVLIPITVGSAQSTAHPIYPMEAGFNFSEFESDTSSPFDNMELKTINDLEELAEVLKTDTVAAVPLADAYATKDSPLNGYYYARPTFVAKPGYGQDADATVESSMRSVPEIMKSLEAQLAGNHIAVQPPQSSTVPADGLDNPFQSLTSELQQMVVKISSMGFPLGRVARACQALDGNEKKIVEHVLAMTDLLDLGFSEARVAGALLQSDNDRDKALDLLIT